MKNKMSQFVGVDDKKDATDNPLVSIITPVLNGIKYLEECSQSVLAQSYPYIEHVFVDGGSTDGTLEMLANYQTKHPARIRFASEPDRGPEDAWNKGLRMAKGEIFGWLGADDVYEPRAIQVVVEFFRANPDAYFLFGDCNYINEQGEIIRKAPTKEFNLQEAINDACYISTSAAFYKREVTEKVGWFDTQGKDLDYWIRVGKVFQIYRIDKTLANFRVREGQVSARGTLKMQFREAYIISRKHRGHVFSPRAARYFIYSSPITICLVPILRPIYQFAIKSKLLRRWLIG